MFHDVPVELVVAQSDSVAHKARFFAVGRRINEVSNVRTLNTASYSSDMVTRLYLL